MMTINDLPYVRKDHKSWAKALGVPSDTVVERLLGRYVDCRGEETDEVYFMYALGGIVVAVYEDMPYLGKIKIMPYSRISKA